MMYLSLLSFFFHYNNFALYVNTNILSNSIIFRFFLQFFTDAKKFFLISSLMHCFSFRFSGNQPHLSSIMPRHNVNKGILTTDRTNLEAAFYYRVEHKCSIKVAAEKFGVKNSTLGVCFCLGQVLAYFFIYLFFLNITQPIGLCRLDQAIF